MISVLRGGMLALLVAGVAAAQDFYDLATIRTIEITFTEGNWDQLLDELYAAGDEERLVGSVSLDGAIFDSVGVRYKGNSSYSASRVKNPLNIKLDHIIDGQTLDGYGTLKLANVYKDPTFVRETLSYEIAAQYFPTSAANYANVYVNDSHLGLYTNVRSVDRGFLSGAYAENDGPFFKGEILQEGPPDEHDIWSYLGPDSTDYGDLYELRSDSGWEQLIHFLDVFNNDVEQIDQVLNLDRHLWILAYHILQVNLDAPVNFAHNYYLYQDAYGRFQHSVWDLNENFGVFSRLLDSGPLTVTDMQQLDPFLHRDAEGYPIIGKALEDDAHERMYIAHMRTILDENFANGEYRARALELQDAIEADVLADPNKFYTDDDFTNNIDSSVGFGMNSVPGITEIMDARVSFLLSHEAFAGTVPTISDVSHDGAAPNSDVSITATINGASQAWLRHRIGDHRPFDAAEMFDDGAHGDGAAGDGTWGAVVAVTTGELQYYIYAENDEQGVFEPAHAANSFMTLVLAGALVINELQADNETTLADDAGEFDDWLELLNGGDEPISLGGYALSDDADSLLLFTLPDTTLAPGTRLLVWADEDMGQEGVHANFRLDAGGESLWLSDPSGVVIDMASWGDQGDDAAWGRFPDGTGSFQEVDPTPLAPNEPVTGISGDVPASTRLVTLRQNAPNPFNPTTTIAFTLERAEHVRLTVYDLQGRKVASLVDEERAAGAHRVNWIAERLPSGVYLYRLQVGDTRLTRRMVLLK